MFHFLHVTATQRWNERGRAGTAAGCYITTTLNNWRLNQYVTLPLERQTLCLSAAATAFSHSPNFPQTSCSDWREPAANSFSLVEQFEDVHLDVEQPRLQVGHGLLSQGQVPGDHVQGLVGEEALVDRRHAGLAADVPHVEQHRVLLWVTRRQEQIKVGDSAQSATCWRPTQTHTMHVYNNTGSLSLSRSFRLKENTLFLLLLLLLYLSVASYLQHRFL